MASHYKQPTDNVVVDGVLIISATQQYGDRFSFVEKLKDHTRIHLDVKKDIRDNYLIEIQALAKIVGIKGISKLKKDELIALVTPRVRFE